MIFTVALSPCEGGSNNDETTGAPTAQGTAERIVAQSTAGEFVAGQLLIKFRDGVAEEDVAGAQARLAATQLKEFSRTGVRHWKLGPGIDVKKALAILARFPFAAHIEFAEPNYVVRIDSLPDDPLFSELYGMHNVGQSGGSIDADIDALEAWQVQTGSADVVVGILDTGVDVNHPDLAQNIWTNPWEIAGNGIDDDGNGYVDDIHGWDFVNSDGDPWDDYGHGTHVAGTIGAIGNNEIGVAGVSWNVKMMPLKVFDSTGNGDVATVVTAIEYLTAFKGGGDNAVRITNNSYGFDRKSKSLERAINGSGTLFACSAGNSGDTSQHYPAAYANKLAEVLSVAATNNADQLAAFSTYSAEWVTLGAPGVNTLSTLPNDNYDFRSGTSMACPHVAGALALAQAHFPGFSNSQLKSAIIDNLDPLASLAGKTITGGRLNIRAALGAAELPADTIAPAAAADLAAGTVSESSVALSWTASADDGSDSQSGKAFFYDLRYMVDVPVDETNWDAAEPAQGEPVPAASGSPEMFTVTGLDGGTTYSFALKVIDEQGNASALSNNASATTGGTPPADWTTELVDAEGNAGYFNALAYDPAGYPAIVYSNNSDGCRLARHNGTSWDIETINSEFCRSVSIAFNPVTGQPAIGYHYVGRLMYAEKNGSGWAKEQIERHNVAGNNVSLKFDGSGNPLIAYFHDDRKGGLKFARKDGAGWHLQLVEAGANAQYLSLAVDPYGQPAIAYSDDVSGTSGFIDGIKYARYDGANWQIQVADSGYTFAGFSASLAFDPVTWRPVIFHCQYPEWMGKLVTYDGSSWGVEDVGLTRYGKMMFDSTGRALVAATYSGVVYLYKKAGSSWESEVVDNEQGSYFGQQPGLDLAPDGMPGVSYNANIADDLHFAKRNP